MSLCVMCCDSACALACWLTALRQTEASIAQHAHAGYTIRDCELRLIWGVMVAVHHEHPPAERISDWGWPHGPLHGQVYQQIHEP